MLLEKADRIQKKKKDTTKLVKTTGLESGSSKKKGGGGGVGGDYLTNCVLGLRWHFNNVFRVKLSMLMISILWLVQVILYDVWERGYCFSCSSI